MQADQITQYIMSKPETLMSFPFGEDVPVFKVKNKVFALIGQRKLNEDGREQLMINLKCDPDEATALCDIFSAIKPGYHMNKKHWISVYIDPVTGSDVPKGELLRLIDNSFLLVVNKLTKAQQVSLRLV
jgi:predicted DNA-binding protein (MmcQ/YjbR family)